MMLAEHLPQPNVLGTMTSTVAENEKRDSQTTPLNDNSNSFTSIKIPLVSTEPILATSPKYILVNEFVKRRKLLVLFDEQLNKWTVRSSFNENVLDALWYDKEQHFLILTSNNIFKFDPLSMNIDLVEDFKPVRNRAFKCFTMLNRTTLLIAYDEWSAEHVEKWQQTGNNIWTMIERQSLELTDNEFVGNMITVDEDNSTSLALTIFNDLTEQWRLELRNAETFIRYKAILLPDSNIAHDYRITPIKNAQSNIKWLVFSSGNTHIVAIDSEWKKIELNYKHPVQRMALFNRNYLIARTTERVDIHFFS